jgi:hypothetical protein
VFIRLKKESELRVLVGPEAPCYTLPHFARYEEVSTMKGLYILIAILAISLLPLGAHAEQWLIVKDKAGKCTIMKTKPGTPTIVSGPYASKDEARKAIKSGECKASEKDAEEKK